MTEHWDATIKDAIDNHPEDFREALQDTLKTAIGIEEGELVVGEFFGDHAYMCNRQALIDQMKAMLRDM